MNKFDPRPLTRYEDDFALWAAEQGALLRAGELGRADLQNLAEEIESLGRSDRYEIDSRMEVLIQHLLKWHLQPAKRSRSWKATFVEQRMRIERILKASPSLRSYPGITLPGSYVIGRNSAINDTGLPEAAFPEASPYTAEQVLDPDFFPGPEDQGT
ncbi:MAG TPA: DUF29 domain-containing protein, partial [Devosia sp.]|jgi:hypothetical protein|nr:DUF29 domain-containing protein [Devosia sp.]